MSIFHPNWPIPIRDAVKSCKSHLVSTVFFSACISLLYLSPTIYMMQVYDRVVPTSGTLTLIWMTIMVAVALGTLVLLDNIRTRLLTRAALKLDQQLSGPILDRLLSALPSNQKGGVQLQAMRDFDTVRQVMSGPAVMALFDLPWFPIFLIVAIIIHPSIGLMITIGGAVLITLALLNERSARERSKSAHKANAAAYASQAELASNAEVIRALGMRRAAVSMQLNERSEGLIENVRNQLSGTRYSAWVKFVRMFLQSLALGVGALLAMKGEISVGTIIAASVLLSRALQPIEQVVGGWSQLAQARQCFANLKQIFEETKGHEKKPLLLPKPVGRVEVTNITLRNPEQNGFIVRGVSFALQPGQMTGLIGHSGAGKSTVGRILAGAIMPEVGDVRIDGATFADWDQELLARHIGYLPQDSSLLPGTIAENISRFSVLAGESTDFVAIEIIKAARTAGIHDLILRFPEGYNTRLGGAGFALSGGQVQRIALARALYGEPSFIVLDEPSSALDGEGEQALLRAIEAAKLRGATILAIAHRSFVMQAADRLIVMANGVVEHQGGRDEVLNDLRDAAQRQNVVSMKRG